MNTIDDCPVVHFGPTTTIIDSPPPVSENVETLAMQQNTIYFPTALDVLNFKNSLGSILAHNPDERREKKLTWTENQRKKAGRAIVLTCADALENHVCSCWPASFSIAH